MINLRPNPILETGRVSYDGVIQLLPRQVSKTLSATLARTPTSSGYHVRGVRDCIVARPGYVFGSCDYEAGELVTHAQSCLWLVGESALADALLRGVKPHNLLASMIAGVEYDDFNARLKSEKRFADYRQAAKPANFGFPGGMGAPKLVLQQRKQGPDTVGPDGTHYKGLRFCVLLGAADRCGTVKVTSYKEKHLPPTCAACIEAAENLRAYWFRTFPENHEYFKIVAALVDENAEVTQHVDRRVRGNVHFRNAANGFFQALLGTAAKLALVRASRECYAVPSSPLYGSRIILFAHDEIIVEHPESVAPEACERLSAVMVEALRETCPDLAPACRAEPTLMRRWYKGAECVRDASGRLMVWEPSA